jgi:hypothetical protein
MSWKVQLSAFVLVTWATAAVAQEKLEQLNLLGAAAKQENIDLEKLRAMSRVTEGAETPELAIEQFVAAAVSANVEQALALIDPGVRPLIALEARLDHDACAERLFDVMLEKEMDAKPQIAVEGFSVIFAERDIVGIRRIEILRKQMLDENSIVFRIIRTARSYHFDGDNQEEQDLLATRCDGRWYIFFLLGHMNWVFRDVLLATEQNKSKPVLDIKRMSTPDSKPEDTDFIEVLSIPIREVHAELVKQCVDADLQEYQRMLRDREVLRHSLESRLARQDFKTFAEWEKAKEPCKDSFEIVANAFSRLISRANESLAKSQRNKK